MVWFPRMLDKIRLHARGELSAEYIPWLGTGFDGRCLRYLRVGTTGESPRRCRLGGRGQQGRRRRFTQGRELSEEDITIWSDFLRKRGWRDSPAVIADLEDSKKQSCLAHRTDLETYFLYNDADEGRDRNA